MTIKQQKKLYNNLRV